MLLGEPDITHTSVIGAYAESQDAVLAIITIIEFWGWMFGHVGHVTEQPDGGDEGLPSCSEKSHTCEISMMVLPD